MSKQLKTEIVIGGKASPSLNKAFQTAQKQAESTSRSMSKIGTALKSAAKVAAVGVVAIGISLGTLSAKGLETASDLKEVQNVVDTTFKTSSKQIDAWSKTALDAYGLSTLQAKQYTGTLGAMMKSSGVASDKLVQMSTKLAGLTGDYASFYNVAQDDAFADLKSAMAGQTETMLKYGINMNIANLKAFALSKGIKTAWQNMDLASQTQLRYLYILEKSKDAQGDFSKTLDESYANQKRVAMTRFNETLGLMATNLLPVATNVLQKANAAMDRFTKNPEKIQLIANTIGNVGSAIFNGIMAFVPTLKWITFTGIPGTINLLDKLLPLIVGIGAAFVAWKIVSIVTGITSAFTKARLALALFSMGQTAAAVQQAALTGTFTAWETIVGLLTGKIKLATVAQQLWNLAMSLNPVGLIIAGVVGLIAIFAVLWVKCEAFRNFWIGLWDGMKTGFVSFVNLIIKGINSWIGNMLAPLNLLIKAANLIPGIKIPEVAFQIPQIPAFGKGGTLTSPQVAVVGDKPETIVPHGNNPRNRALLKEAAAGVGISGGGDTIITFAPVIQGGGADVKKQLSDAEEEFERKIDAYFARKRRLSYV